MVMFFFIALAVFAFIFLMGVYFERLMMWCFDHTKYLWLMFIGSCVMVAILLLLRKL